MAKSLGAVGRSALRSLPRLGGWFALIVLLAYGASNIWLSSRWGKGVAETKLKARTGLDWQVESMSWSPWNGVTISGAQMLQPEALRPYLSEPLIAVDRIRVRPYWSPLLRGRVRMRELQLNAPKLTVAVEMLAAMASDASPSQVLPPPVVTAQKPHSDGPKKEPAMPSIPAKQPATPAKKSATSPKHPKRPPAGLPLRFRIDDASLRLVSASKNMEFIRLDRASLDLPVFGEDAKGVIKVEALKIPGFSEMTGLEQVIDWKRPYLEMKEEALDIGGLKLHFHGKLGVGKGVRGMFPFFCAVTADPQKINKVKWFERLALEVSSKKLAGRIHLAGSLPNPMSWRAEMLMHAEDVALKEEHGRHDVVFEEVALPAILRQGQVRWSGVRLIGEDVSILGNGQVSVRDGILSVTRLVVSPEVAEMLRRGLNGAGLIKAGGGWWKDLDTPDRKMRDLLVSGSLADAVVDVGKNDADVPVAQIVMTTLNFIRMEMKEEGKVLPPVPNKELLNGEKYENY
ncbi:MAG: hypothetical protein KJO21_01470 [Verrucomicrobiae bacterium]|nr:hypothetical protein [Verrucomicrobiae bacterium]NNJ42204.1 hypothetical protein [Akkermansiaceae bacterium]